jgi:hypothetical protein
MDDGRVETVTLLNNGQISQAALNRLLPAGQPPVVDVQNGTLVDGTNLAGASTLTHPIVTRQGQRLWINDNGDVVLGSPDSEEMDRVAIHALPDARLVFNQDTVALYAGATDIYDHGILGDGLEGSQLVVLDTSTGELQFRTQIAPPAGFVYEGISPMLVDWNQDDQLEILATISDSQTGSRFVLYSLEGVRLAESESIGQGYRWRHQIAVAAVEAGGELWLVSVLRPHLDGTVQLHAWRGDQLVEVASLAGYSSHRIGERNVDQAVAGDFDGDGAVELLLGDLQMGVLTMLGWDEEGLVEEWRFALAGIMVTNLGLIETQQGSLSVAVGTDGGQLLVWISGP